MTGALTLYRSSIGKKAVMAVTGVVLVGFLLVHMYGNLKIFLGPAYFNEYAAGLRSIGAPIFSHEHLLWLMRVILLGSVVLHITAAVQLTQQDRAGRPVRYARKRHIKATLASRTMRWGGVTIFLFILYHLLHFTFGYVGFASGSYRPEQDGQFFPYQNVVNGFQVWPVTIFYILALLALGMHLYHGTWSMFQTLGWNNAKYDGLLRGVATLLALVIVGGFISVPIAVLTGFVH